MSPMSWISAALAGALGLASLFGWYEHGENVKLSASISTYKANESALTASNKTKDAAIKELQDKLDEVSGQKQQVELARDAALTAQAAARTALARAAAETKKLRSQIYARDVASREWAFSPVPDALSRELCDQWSAAGGDAGPGCGRAAPAVRSDSAGTAGAAVPTAIAVAGVLPGACAAGCFSNDQLRDALDGALSWGQQCRAQLTAIGELSRKAVEATASP